MTRASVRISRCLALAHHAWAAILILWALWWTIGAFLVLPHLSSGTPWSNLPIALSSALVNAGPPAALGAWMAVLGRRLWQARPGLRRALLWTHGLLLVPGILFTLAGIQAMESAARSTARGGGLMSPLAVIPLATGIPILLVSLTSLTVALLILPKGESRLK